MPSKHETLVDTNISNSNDDESSTTRMPLDERIRLLDKHMHEMSHGQQKSTTSSSSSSSSSSLSPATLIEQQNQKTTSTTTTTATTANTNTAMKSVNELVSTLSSSTPSATLAQCIQAVRVAALNAQPTPSISPSKVTPTISTSSPFHFPGTSVSPLSLNRTISTTSPSPVNISSVLTPPPPPPPPPPPFPNLQRLSDPSSTSILTTFQAAIAQTQMAAAAKYNPL